MVSFTLFALISVISTALAIHYPYHYGGGHLGGLGGGHLGGHGGGGAEDNGPAFYKFEYGVHDPHTGDVKSQHEHRHGKNVEGGYTLKEADGTTRVVKYHAGPHGGLTALVQRIGHAQHPAVYGTHHGGHYGGGHHGGYNGAAHGHGGTSYVGTTNFGHFGHHY